MLNIIAHRGGGGTYLVVASDKGRRGFVASEEEGVRYPEMNLDSILARGYWEPFGHDENLLQRVLALPLAK